MLTAQTHFNDSTKTSPFQCTSEKSVILTQPSTQIFYTDAPKKTESEGLLRLKLRNNHTTHYKPTTV